MRRHSIGQGAEYKIMGIGMLREDLLFYLKVSQTHMKNLETWEKSNKLDAQQGLNLAKKVNDNIVAGKRLLNDIESMLNDIESMLAEENKRAPRDVIIALKGHIDTTQKLVKIHNIASG